MALSILLLMVGVGQSVTASDNYNYVTPVDDPAYSNIGSELEIRKLKSQYFLCLDSKQWDCFRSVFASGFRLRIFEPGENEPRFEITGIDNMVTATRESVDESTTIHHGHEPLIEILSENEARGTWPAQGIMRRKVNDRFVTRHAFNLYHETYKKENGDWKISSTDLIRKFFVWDMDSEVDLKSRF